MADSKAVASGNADDENGNDVAKRGPFSADDYARIGSGGNAFADAMGLIESKLGGEVVSAEDLGDGFSVLDNKGILVGVPLVVLAAAFYPGKYGEDFISLRVVTEDGRKLIINDGGTGIPQQVKMLHERRPETIGTPILVRKGLRVSRYTHPEHGEAETFYLDTSK